MRFIKRRKPEPSARSQVNLWLEWCALSGMSHNTIAGYRQMTNKLLDRGTIPSKERVVPSINHPSPKEAGWLDRDSPSTAYSGRDDL